MTLTGSPIDVTAVGESTVVCSLTDIPDCGGVAAVVGDHEVAIFRVGDQVFCLALLDPFSGANVLSRGIVGGDDTRMWVASPMYKQRFDLRTGVCVDDESVQIDTWSVEVSDDGKVAVIH